MTSGQETWVFPADMCAGGNMTQPPGDSDLTNLFKQFRSVQNGGGDGAGSPSANATASTPMGEQNSPNGFTFQFPSHSLPAFPFSSSQNGASVTGGAFDFQFVNMDPPGLSKTPMQPPEEAAPMHDAPPTAVMSEAAAGSDAAALGPDTASEGDNMGADRQGIASPPAADVSNPAISVRKVVSSWVDRNRGRLLLPVRPHNVRKALTPEARLEKKIQSAVNRQAHVALTEDLKAYFQERSDMVREIASKHAKSHNYVKSLVHHNSKFVSQRSVTLKNAFYSKKMKEVNQGLPEGGKHSLTQVQKMYNWKIETAEFTDEEKNDLRRGLEKQRETKTHSIRSSELACARDATTNLGRLGVEFENLFIRDGITALVVFSRGNHRDEVMPGYITTGDTALFIQEAFDISPAELTRKLERWVCDRKKRGDKQEDLASLRSDVSKLISDQLSLATNGATATMNYLSYETAIVWAHGVLVEKWPKDIEFVCPGTMGVKNDLRRLRTLWESGECRWKILTKEEVRRRQKAALAPPSSEGQTATTTSAPATASTAPGAPAASTTDTNLPTAPLVIRKRKERSDKGKKRGPRRRLDVDADGEAPAPVRPARPLPRRAGCSIAAQIPPACSKKTIEDSDNGGTDED